MEEANLLSRSDLDNRVGMISPSPEIESLRSALDHHYQHSPTLRPSETQSEDSTLSELTRAQYIEPLPRYYLRDFQTEIVSSTLDHQNPDMVSQRVVEAFNQGRTTIMSKSNWLGSRIQKNQYRLVARNNVPELVPFNEYKMFKFPYLTGTAEDIGVFNHTDLYFGAHGSHVVNVPPGMIAKAWKGNHPILLGPGPHVIHDQNFKKVEAKDLIKMDFEQFQHGIYNVFRVPPGTQALVKIGTMSYFLNARLEPYVFTDPTFKLIKIVPLVKVGDLLTHGNYRVFRVPPGHKALVWLGATPYFLEARSEPYIFSDPTFRLEKIVSLCQEYIHHGNYHILRIPQGKVAKIWLGSEPRILEARDQPYEFNNPLFRLAKVNETTNYADADAPAIIHGSIKRLMPRTGTVAVTYNNGNLVTYGPSEDSKPIMITSQNHTFESFLTINTRTLEFPSEETRKMRRKQGAERPEDIVYEIFRTSDGLPIGVKLLVVYEITDPNTTLSKLDLDQVLPHIESLVVADMGMVIQNCSSTDFLKSNQTQARAAMVPPDDPSIPSAPEFYEHLQDEVKNKLHNDFREYGIKLIRLNIETPKILDQTIANKMAEFSLMNSEARAKEAVLDRNFNIAQQEANQKAKEVEIRQKQENDNKISIARAELEAARLRAEAQKLEAQVEAQAIIAKAEAEAKAQEMLMDIAQKRGLIYKNNPELLHYDLAQAQAQAMKGISSTIVSPEVAAHYYGMGQTPTVFRPSVPNTPKLQITASTNESVDLDQAKTA